MSRAKMDWNGKGIVSSIESAINGALNKSAHDLMIQSTNQIPVDSGSLRSDCNTQVSRLDSRWIMRVGYSLPYALAQHEDIGQNHPTGGKAKYLEDPYNESIDKYKEYIKEAIGQVIK